MSRYGLVRTGRRCGARYPVARSSGRFNGLVPVRSLSLAAKDDFSDEAAFVVRTKPWSPRPRLTVFYDGGCGLCAAEIGHYEKLQKQLKERTIDFHNVRSHNHEEMERRGISMESQLERLHVIDEQGKLFKNAEAFQQVWKRSPYWRHTVYPLTTLPGVIHAGNWLYDRFVMNRSNRKKEKSCM